MPRVKRPTSGKTSERRYWINTVSRDHVAIGVAGGFTQAGHGRSSGLKQLAQDDLLVFYSPRTAYDGGDPLQSFTAIGRITDDAPYQADVTKTLHPWRRRVAFVPSMEAPIRPLIGSLDFITDKKSWGYPFRRGLFAVSRSDFMVIASAMGADADADRR